jgi:hypothetical protein
MTKISKPKTKKPKSIQVPDEYEIELEPEAWEQFEKLVKQAAKMGPAA